jgi:hypothetical protein
VAAAAAAQDALLALVAVAMAAPPSLTAQQAPLAQQAQQVPSPAGVARQKPASALASGRQPAVPLG